MRPAALLLFSLLACGCTTAEPDPCQEGLALRGVTIVDGRGNDPVPDQTVLVCGGRIAEVGATAEVVVPEGARAPDLTGHFVLPGFVDTHAHVTILPMDADGRLERRMDRAASEQVLRVLLAFGITTARNPAAPTEDGVALRDAVASGIVPGPRLRTAGEALNRATRGSGPAVATPDTAAVRAEVRRQAAAGVDYVKVYATMPPDLVGVAVEEAHAQGLEVIGHLQRTTWTEAARLGIDHITHGAPWSAEYLPEALRREYRGTLRDRMTWLERVDLQGPAIRAMITALAEGGVTLDPTLIAYRTKFVGDDPAYRFDPDSIYAPATVWAMWQRGTFTDGWSPEDYARGRRVWPRVLALTRALHEGGVLLTAGSDLPNPWVVPGAGFHDELQLLGSAGLSNLDVLRVATYNGALSMGLEDEIGSVEVGKVADLIVLSEDPSADLAHTRSIEFVVQGGRLHRPQVLLTP